MIRFRHVRPSRLALLAATLGALAAAAPAAAQTAVQTGATPPAAATAASASVDGKPQAEVLKYLISQGVKITALGERHGLAGYLIEASNGKQQVIYVTPDGEAAVAGLMLRAGGVNETGVQLGDLKQRMEAAKAGAASQPQAAAPAGAKEAAAVAAPAQPAPQAAAATQQAQGLDKKAFLAEVDRAAWFSIGEDSAPAVYMVVDPSCPHCHRAWSALIPYVKDGRIQLRLIMIGVLAGSEPKAVSILARKSPGEAWLAGEGSTDGPVSAPPADDSREARNAREMLGINLKVAQTLKVKGTPTLAYVAKDDSVRLSSGMPASLDAFLADLPK